ncbi:OmpH family outer membrane protein [Limnochorda pilosa]|uniref:Molecular chaperone Skp n=1 Tax=Limnochorda pilosa TaxID=1555112 RepID=A0A0K2SMA5_LIMPI|nr:OmpH family outer membrane protein [Limnochorda pilosa]BAS28246.1 molecular chaperone Skp [Limnochorda pilosa]
MNTTSFPARVRRLARRPPTVVSVGLVLIVALAAVLFLRGGTASEAQNTSGVGFVDWAQVQTGYLQPKLQEPVGELQQMQDDLQKEFDEKSKGMDDAKKQELFQQYQQRLDEKTAALKELEAKYIAEVQQIVADQAQKQGLQLVLRKDVVIQGGVDLTPDVLKALGVQK